MVDTVSTLEALKHGGREANPVVAPFASNAGALYSLKVVTTVGSIWAAEKLWKRNRAAAIVTMLAVNAGYAWVAHHNYPIAGRQTTLACPRSRPNGRLAVCQSALSSRAQWEYVQASPISDGDDGPGKLHPEWS